MIGEIIVLLTIVPTVLAGLITAFIAIMDKFCDGVVIPVIEFIWHLFGM